MLDREEISLLLLQEFMFCISVTFTFYLTSVVTLLYIATLTSLKGGMCI